MAVFPNCLKTPSWLAVIIRDGLQTLSEPAGKQCECFEADCEDSVECMEVEAGRGEPGLGGSRRSVQHSRSEKSLHDWVRAEEKGGSNSGEDGAASWRGEVSYIMSRSLLEKPERYGGIQCLRVCSPSLA